MELCAASHAQLTASVEPSQADPGAGGDVLSPTLRVSFNCGIAVTRVADRRPSAPTPRACRVRRGRWQIARNRRRNRGHRQLPGRAQRSRARSMCRLASGRCAGARRDRAASKWRMRSLAAALTASACGSLRGLWAVMKTPCVAPCASSTASRLRLSCPIRATISRPPSSTMYSVERYEAIGAGSGFIRYLRLGS